MTTTTIRVSIQTRDLLHNLARQSGRSMQGVLEQALDQYRRQQILEAVNTAYAALQTDSGAWADLEAERREWDQTMADGLEAV
jgi:hypothetical protein